MLRSIFQQRLTYSIGLCAIVAVAVLGALFLNRGATARASQETYVELIQPAEVKAGEQVNIQLVVNNAKNLAGFQSTVVYDVAGLHVAAASVDNGLKSSGRDLMKLGPTGGNGSVTLGAATCPAADCSAAQAWTATRQPAGVNGRVDLATLSFYADEPGRYTVKLTDVQLVDPQGNLLTTTTATASVEVVAR